MKTLYLTFFFLLLTLASAHAESVQNSLFRYIVTAINQNDPVRALQQFSKDATIRIVDEKGLDPASKASLLSYFKNRAEGYSERNLLIKRIFQFNGGVIAQYIDTGKALDEGEHMGLVEGVILLEVKNHKISKWIDYRSGDRFDKSLERKILDLTGITGNTTTAHIQSDSSQSAIHEMVKQFYNSINDRDFDALESFFRKEALISLYATATELRGIERIIESYQELHGKWPQSNVSILDIKTAKNIALLHASAAAGEKNEEYIEVFHFWDGKIHHIERYFNNTTN